MSALGSLYGRVAALRRAWYERVPDRRHRLARPVISVGNLVVGGSGKTPVVAWLARLLLEKGHRPAILSRGYGRRAHRDGVVVVSDGDRVLAPTAMSGDEPQMLARALPGVAVLVAPDRSLAGTLAERRLGCTIHLLDDGFQHLQLARDVDLLLMGRDDLTERILPSGRLRESLATARRADAVLVPGTEEDVAVVAATLHIEQAFRVVPRFGEPLLVHPNGATVHASAGKRAIAVAAIARPQRFFATLRSQGWDVVREFAFRDHHWFTPADLDRVRRAAREEHADIILTTAKDAVRIEAQDGHWAYLPMDVSIEPAAAFSSWLEQQL